MGGVFRTPVHGCDWQHFPVGEGEAQVNAILPHPSRPGLVYAGTQYGLFRSEDHGKQWERMSLPNPTECIWSIAFDPQNPDTMFVGTSPPRVYRSDDGGKSWSSDETSARPERLDFPFESRVMEIAIDPRNPDHVYASLELNGVIRSRDAGETWEDCTEGLLEFPKRETKYRNKVAVDDDREGILDGHSICVVGEDSIIYANRLGLFGSENGGMSWVDKNIGGFSDLTYARDIKISPHDPNEIAVCLNIYSNGTRGSVAKSFDSGKTWSRFDHGTELESTALKLAYGRQDARRLAAISFYGQLLLTLDGGKWFTLRQLPKEAMEGYSVCFV